MMTKWWRPALLGLALAGGAISTATADDTIRLGAKGSIKDGGGTITRLDLRPNDVADTIDVGHRYGFRGYYGGFGFSSYSYYPRYSVGFSYYRPHYYSPSYYRPHYYSPGYYRPYYYSAPYYSYRYYSAPVFYGGFCGIGGSAEVIEAPVATLEIRPAAAEQPFRPMNPSVGQSAPIPFRSPSIDGTFPYDGGPANPVPMPRQDADPSKQSAPKNVLPDRAVSLPLEKQPVKKYTYAAYGEKPKSEPVKEEKLIVVKITR